MTEQYVNDAASVLDSGINDTQTTLDVASATGFPTAGNFRIRIGDELLRVTGVSGETFTVERGSEGTTPASHASGANVTHVLTAESLRRIIVEAGSLHRPKLIDFAWVNQGGATATQNDQGIYLETPGSTGDSVRLLTQSAPATPYTITTGFRALLINSGIPSFGVCWRDSGSGKLSSLLARSDSGAPALQIPSNWNSVTAFANYGTLARITQPDIWWLRIEDDGTNHKMSVSLDGVNFQQCYSGSRTAWLSNPNQVAVFSNSYYGTVPLQVQFLCWRIE